MPLELLANLDLSAASGLVCRGQALFTVADDALELLRTDLRGGNAVRFPLRPGATHATLPKKDKPDFEALFTWEDALVAVGSGSGPARRKAVVFREGATREVDLSPLYDVLAQRLTELNLEGAVLWGDGLWLAQRGNGADGQNALIRLDRALAEQQLAQGVLTGACLREVVPVSLGQLGDVPLTLTDLCVGPGETLFFTAAAEATTSSWDDGVIAGSVVGRLTAQGQVSGAVVQAPGVKLEGVCVVSPGELRLVADPDDPKARAPLFRLAWL